MAEVASHTSSIPMGEHKEDANTSSTASSITAETVDTQTPAQTITDKNQCLSPAVVLSSVSLSGPASINPYMSLMNRLHSNWQDCPSIHIQYDQLCYSVPIPVCETGTRSFLRVGWDGIVSLLNKLDVTGLLTSKQEMTTLNALAPCSGNIHPGTMTLILAPPGHGKSTLLKALSGRLNQSKYLHGQLLYNGVNATQLHRQGVRLHKVLAYVDQVDTHFPVLTVEETLSFAAKNVCAPTSLFHDQELARMEQQRTERLMTLLGLTECSGTIIGNDLLHGISGGQRKRVTLGEMLVSNARVLCLDEVTSGLDSAIAFQIMKALQIYCQSCHNTVITALLQPTPETYSLFDDVILMREGWIVYHGPRSGVRCWFQNQLGVTIPDDEDEAGFVVDFLSNPTLVLDNERKKQERKQRQIQREAQRGTNRDKLPIAGVERSNDDQVKTWKGDETLQVPAHAVNGSSTVEDDDLCEPDVPVKSPPSISAIENGLLCLTTEQMVNRWKQSNLYHDLTSTPIATHSLDPSTWSAFTRCQFAQSFPHSATHHLCLALTRQLKLFRRNKQVIAPRLFQCVLMGVVYGTLFLNISLTDYDSKVGLFMYVLMFGALANLTELPVAAEARAVVVKQLDAGFYPTLPYIFSVIFCAIPLMVAEAIVYGSFMYWLPAFTPEPGRFFFFILLIFVYSLSISTFFRAISYCTPNPDVASQLDFPFMVLGIIFGGYLVPYSQIPKWLIWCFWVSPVSWAFRSLALNEFKADRYDYIVQQQQAGDYYLTQYQISSDDAYKWGGIGYLVGFSLSFAFLSAVAITYMRDEEARGTKRLPATAAETKQPKHTETDKTTTEHTCVDVLTLNSLQKTQVTSSTSQLPVVFYAVDRDLAISMTGMPFTPVTLIWKDIHYWVQVDKVKNNTARKELLAGVSGYSKPGTLTALMGSSGAGKVK